MFNTTINDNSKNTGFFNNNLKNEVKITTKKGLFKNKVTVSSSKEIKRNKKKGCDFMFNVTTITVNSKGLVSVITDDKTTRKKRFLDRNKSIATKSSISSDKKKPSLFNKKKENDHMLDFNKIETSGLCFSSSISSGKKKPSLFNKKKEGINMNKNLVKVLVAGVAVGVAVAGAVVITKKVKARKARKAEEVKEETTTEETEEVEETETDEEREKEAQAEQKKKDLDEGKYPGDKGISIKREESPKNLAEDLVQADRSGKEKGTYKDLNEEKAARKNYDKVNEERRAKYGKKETETEEAETENDDNDDVPVLVEIILIRVGKFVGICIGLLLGNLILRDSARLAEATKCL